MCKRVPIVVDWRDLETDPGKVMRLADDGPVDVTRDGEVMLTISRHVVRAVDRWRDVRAAYRHDVLVQLEETAVALRETAKPKHAAAFDAASDVLREAMEDTP